LIQIGHRDVFQYGWSFFKMILDFMAERAKKESA